MGYISLNRLFKEYHENLGDTDFQSSSTIKETPKKWANIILSGEDEPLLEGTIWANTFSSKYIILLTYEFRAGGKLVRNFTSRESIIENSVESKIETSTYIEIWSREGDIVKAIFGNGATLFEGKYYSQPPRIIGISYYSDGRSLEETWIPHQK